jgi:uncharacterized membrane protein
MFRDQLIGIFIIFVGWGLIAIALKLANKIQKSRKFIPATIAVFFAGALVMVHGLFYAAGENLWKLTSPDRRSENVHVLKATKMLYERRDVI